MIQKISQWLHTESSYCYAMLHLEEKGPFLNNHLKLSCKGLLMHDFSELPYPIPQLLEPAVLLEVSKYSNIPLDNLKRLDYKSTGSIKKIQNMLKNEDDINSVEKLNLSYSLASILRYEESLRVLTNININTLNKATKFYYLVLRLMIKNRLTPSQSLTEDLSLIKVTLEEMKMPEQQTILASNIAIVWEIKANLVGNKIFKWFLEKGLEAQKNIQPDGFWNLLCKSSFHRAIAMLPAQEGKKNQTRKEMEQAYDLLQVATPNNELEYYIKKEVILATLQSKFKEMSYVAQDYAKAEKAGFKLIKEEPNWSLYYQDMGKFYLENKKIKKALSMYKKARDIGAPRTVLTNYQIGVCFAKMNQIDESLNEFERVLEMDPTNYSAVKMGIQIAQQTKHKKLKYFQDFFYKLYDKKKFE